MLSWNLAFKNVTKAGLRTWLNVLVLSFAFVLIIWTDGFYDGMSKQVVNDMEKTAIGGGQFWQSNYDPFDPFSLDESHSPIPEKLQQAISEGNATAKLLRSCAMFPNGRVQSAIINGIDPDQTILDFPSSVLSKSQNGSIPGLIGARMAKNSGLQVGDLVTVRWRDINGTFDAADVEIENIFTSNVQTIDNGQIYIPLKTLQNMMSAENQATIITVKKGMETILPGTPSWEFKDHQFLLKDFYDYIKRKGVGSNILYAILLGMALLAIFDTQVLSIFRRRKEMGTMMALGMTRGKVIRLFTLEGTMHGLLAIVIGCIYGIPFLMWSEKAGIGMPDAVDQVGLSLSTTLYPVYGIGLFISTSIILFISVVIVSFLPTRKIAKLNPTDALRGKMS